MTYIHFLKENFTGNEGVTIMKSNFDQEIIFIALSNAKSLEFLWAALDIHKNTCFHF